MPKPKEVCVRAQRAAEPSFVAAMAERLRA